MQIPAEAITVRVEQAAAMLGLSQSTVRNMIKEGKLSAIRMGTRQTLIKVEDLREWVESHARKE